MWKKMFLGIIAMIGAFSAAYAYYDHSMSAASNNYQVGGNVTGRINMAPSGITGDHIGLQEGDHVMIGGDNPYTGNPLSFQLLFYDQNYTDYNNTDTIKTVRTPISNWLTASDEMVTDTFILQSYDESVTVLNKNTGVSGGKTYYTFSDYTKTPHYQRENVFSQYLNANAEQALLAPRNLWHLRKWVDDANYKNMLDSHNAYHVPTGVSIMLKNAKDLPAFMPSYFRVNNSDPQFNANRINFYNKYYVSVYYRAYNSNYPTEPSQTSASMVFINAPGNANGFTITSLRNNAFYIASFRPFLYLNLSNTVFGISSSDVSGIRSSVDDTFLINAGSDYYLQGGSTMKLRMLDPNMNVSFNKIANKKEATISQAAKDSTVYLYGTGNQGAQYKISALIFDSENHLVGYQPLEDTKTGEYAYAFDTTDLPVGKYKIALVNEVFDTGSTDPTYSSLISDTLPLEIVNPLSITATPKTDLKYNQNVNQNDVVATYITKDGVAPITTTLVSDTSVNNHSNDYQLFSLSNGNVTVKESKGLNAGDYYFKLKAVDANGDPSDGVFTDTVHIHVDKADLTISFENPNQTKKSIAQASAEWSESATANPSTGTKVTYARSGGDVALINIDATTGKITYKGNNTSGTVKIQASVDDDPSSGFDNYNPASTEKEIFIYKEVDADVIPHSDSGDTKIPTFTADQANVLIGGTIGTIKGKNGTPDTVNSDSVTFTYTLKNGGDSNLFQVDPSTGEITSKVNLGVDDYTFQITVSDHWSSKDINVTVKVLMIPSDETIQDDWYHLELDDGNHTPYNGTWTNQDVNIISDHDEYNQISLDGSTWNMKQATVTKEGETNQSFWLKKDNGALTKDKKELIRIDKTAPKLAGIRTKDTNDKLQDLINKLTYGIFFRPGTSFEITTSDINGSQKVSGTKEINYRIYRIQDQKEEEISSGVLAVTNEKASVKISDTTGKYKVCVIPKDHAGNVGEQTCREVTLKKINIDVDGDDKLDFNDPDNDGCPDLNIVLGKDEDGFDIKLNIDANGDGIPELNIDTDGDGKPDINVDQDGDGKADLNIASHIKWNPDYCVTGQKEEYCTDRTIIPDLNIDLDGDGRPDINIDLDHDGLPDIDIDTDGDGKPDINIDKDKDGSADENLKEITEWKPDQSCNVNGKEYHTMPNLKPDVKDKLIDNEVIAEKPDGTPFLPNMALKVTDVTEDKKEEVNQNANDMMGEDQEVKQVFDVKLLENGVEVKPDGTLKIRIPIQDNIKNPILLKRNEDGTYEKIDITIENGYLVYESDELGIVSILGDIVKEENNEVQGSYTPGKNTGGAMTADTTNGMLHISMGCISLGIILSMVFKRK